MSILVPRAESILGLIELLELLRLLSRWSFGLSGFKPDCRANRLRTSVREITPVRRPEMRAPGSADAEMGNAALRDGDAGVELVLGARTACVIEGVAEGVAGAEGEGEALSTTHIR